VYPFTAGHKKVPAETGTSKIGHWFFRDWI